MIYRPQFIRKQSSRTRLESHMEATSWLEANPQQYVWVQNTMSTPATMQEDDSPHQTTFADMGNSRLPTVAKRADCAEMPPTSSSASRALAA